VGFAAPVQMAPGRAGMPASRATCSLGEGPASRRWRRFSAGRAAMRRPMDDDRASPIRWQDRRGVGGQAHLRKWRWRHASSGSAVLVTGQPRAGGGARTRARPAERAGGPVARGREEVEAVAAEIPRLGGREAHGPRPTWAQRTRSIRSRAQPQHSWARSMFWSMTRAPWDRYRCGPSPKPSEDFQRC
jgi:hypothetical protein